MCPSLESEIGLSVKPDAEYDDSEEAGDVTRQLPVFPFTRLSGRRRRPVE